MKVIGILSIVIMLAAQAAMAQSDSPRGPASGHTAILLNQLVYPCEATCLSDDNSCAASVETTALGDIDSACSSQISAAQSACSSEHTSKACRSAYGSLATCAESDVKTYESALATCEKALETCLDACEK